MARNEVMMHLEDRQLNDIKKSIKQSQLKYETELGKVRKQLDQLSHRLNEVLIELREMKVEPVRIADREGLEATDYDLTKELLRDMPTGPLLDSKRKKEDI